MCGNKPFKASLTELCDQWLSEGVHQFTEGGNMKLPYRKRIIEWVVDVWPQLLKENIKLFKCCGVNLASDGMGDDFIYCLRKGQSCKAGKKKLNSQLSILIGKSDAINPFTSSSDEEDANEEVVIEDEKDEEIIM